jgi:hypothetical protein
MERIWALNAGPLLVPKMGPLLVPETSAVCNFLNKASKEKCTKRCEKWDQKWSHFWDQNWSHVWDQNRPFFASAGDSWGALEGGLRGVARRGGKCLRAFGIGGGVEVYASLAGIFLREAENSWDRRKVLAKASVGGWERGRPAISIGGRSRKFRNGRNRNAVELHERR